MVLMTIIPLTDEQKRELLHLSQNAPELLIHRARLILAYSQGKPTLQAAAEAGMSRGRARYWKRQFLAKGMEIFTQERSPISRAGQVTSSENKKVKKAANQQPSPQLEHDTGTRLEISYPNPLASIGLDPDDTLSEAGRKVWLYHFALMLAHEEGTLRGEDSEELHDMRVATRRMRTAFDIFGPAYDPKSIKQHLNGLRRIGKALGTVRDMDVILEHAVSYQNKLQESGRLGLEPLLSEWKRQIDKKRSKMLKYLQSEAYQDFLHDFNLFLQQPDHIDDSIIQETSDSHLRDIVPVLIYTRYAAVRAYQSILPAASMQQLHALRIDFKKFRYTLEYFREILGESTKSVITELKQYQDHLGVLHDADVACDLVKTFLSDWEQDQQEKLILERQNPKQIVTYLAYLYAERYRLTSSFPKLWSKFSRSEFRQMIAQAISVL